MLERIRKGKAPDCWGVAVLLYIGYLGKSSPLTFEWKLNKGRKSKP